MSRAMRVWIVDDVCCAGRCGGGTPRRWWANDRDDVEEGGEVKMRAPSWICPCCEDPRCDGSCCGGGCR